VPAPLELLELLAGAPALSADADDVGLLLQPAATAARAPIAAHSTARRIVVLIVTAPLQPFRIHRDSD
jgi:hypothetical protein